MKRKLVMLATAMMILALAAPAWAAPVTLDFTSLFGGYTAGSYDQLNFNGLTVTARTAVGTGITNVPDPWGPRPPNINGVPGDVYWGNLGDLGVVGRSYFGLGVLTNNQTPIDYTTGPITFSETLRFHFDTPQVGQGVGMQIHFTALGLDAYSSSGGSGFPADNMRVYIKVASGEVLFADMNLGAIGIFGPDFGSVINWMLTQTNINFADERVTDFAVEQISGSATPNRQYGIGSVTYNVVPEPLTLLLLGAGLIGLAGIRRFRK